jgi:hypothetical protein
MKERFKEQDVLFYRQAGIKEVIPSYGMPRPRRILYGKILYESCISAILPPLEHIVSYLLKARIAKSAEIDTFREQLRKHSRS